MLIMELLAQKCLEEGQNKWANKNAYMESSDNFQLKHPDRVHKEGYILDPEECSCPSYKCGEKGNLEKVKETGQQDNCPPLTISTAPMYNPPPDEDEITMGDSTADMRMTNMEHSIQDLHGDMDQIKNNLQNLLQVLCNPSSSAALASNAPLRECQRSMRIFGRQGVSLI